LSIDSRIPKLNFHEPGHSISDPRLWFKRYANMPEKAVASRQIAGSRVRRVKQLPRVASHAGAPCRFDARRPQ
jgi:hypothetical protein